MKYREILEECRKHIQNVPNVYWTKCEECPLFPERIKDGKLYDGICSAFQQITGMPTDRVARLFENIKDEWLDREAKV